MKQFARLFTLLIAGLVISGCVVNPVRKEIDGKAAANIRHTSVVSVIAQDEIVPQVINPNISQAAGGGLLVALIDASIIESRTKEAEALMPPLRQSLAGMDFRKSFWQRQQKLFGGENWLHTRSPENTALDITPSQIQDRVKIMQEDAFLILRTEYKLSAEFDRMVVQSYVQLWNRGEELPSYAARIEYQSPSVPATDKAGAIEFWSKQEGKAARNALAEGMDEIVRIIELDLFRNRGSTPATGESVSLVFASDTPAFGKTMTAEVVEKHGNRYLVKRGDGRLVSLVENDEFNIAEAGEVTSGEAEVVAASVPASVTSKPVTTTANIAKAKQPVVEAAVNSKPVVLVVWAEPGAYLLYKSSSVNSYSRLVSGSLKSVTQSYMPKDAEIIPVVGEPARYIAEDLTPVAQMKSICDAKHAEFVLSAISEIAPSDDAGPSKFARDVDYHFVDCTTTRSLSNKSRLEVSNRDRFAFEKSYATSFGDFLARSISSARGLAAATK